MHRFSEQFPLRQKEPLRVIRHPISSSTSFSLAGDAERARDNKSVAEWLALAEEMERQEEREAAELREIEDRKRKAVKDLEREVLHRHVRRYGL